jgi:antitoxin (DNA-binding transcriptional repressor) of toxin-antitoxin stability system
MSERVSVRQLEAQLSELLERTVESGQECIIERDGEAYAVLVSAHAWEQNQRRTRLSEGTLDQEEARARAVGERLDALGPEYRLSPERQKRLSELLARREIAQLMPEEESELRALSAECDQIMLRRAQALHQGR